MLTEAFSTLSTRTSTPGWFVKFKIIDGIPTVSGEMTLEVVETTISEGAITIGEGYMVLTAARQSGYSAEYEKFKVGDIVTLTTVCEDENLVKAKYATGAGDVLISDGVRLDSGKWDITLMQRAPRTAFGVRGDGTIVSYAVDGRNSTHSVGLTLDELADEMLSQGCVYAVNFDGGGSTALSVRIPGENIATVVSRPSDGSERGCATYILYVTDAEPDGTERNLGLQNDGAILLAKSSVELSFTATDRGYMPTAIPDDIQIFPQDSGASVDGTLYTAGSTAGAERLKLYSPATGAYGSGEIFVITRPTSITPTWKNSSVPLTSVRIFPGDTLELDVLATYYRRTVTAQVHSFTFTVSEDIGAVTNQGVFTAAGVLGQKGTITVSAGGRSSEIKVEIGGFLDMQNHWAREYARYLESTGIVTGVTPLSFDPERMMSRGDFCLMLYRAAGTPAFSGVSGFDDVPDDAYYAKAIAWAQAKEIAKAVDGNVFNPTAPLSRQDAFTFIYRALSLLNKQFSNGTATDLTGFPDANSLADYAVIPTATLINLGLVGGMDGRLEPTGTLTRAQMAKIVATVIQL